MKSLRSMALAMCAMSTLLVGPPAFAQEAPSAQSDDALQEQKAMIGPSEVDVLLAAVPINEAIAASGRFIAVGAEGAEGGHGGWHHEGPLSGATALTDDQYEKLYSLRNQFLDAMSPKCSQLGILHRQLKESLASSNFDAKRSADLGNKINSLKSEIETAKMDRVIASAQVLTSDQRKSLHEHMIRHAAMFPGMAGPMKGHHGHGGGHGEGGMEHGGM